MSTTVMGIISVAVVLMISLALLPTLLEKINDIDQQTRAHCESDGVFFTEVNSAADWTGTRYAVAAGGSNGCQITVTEVATRGASGPALPEEPEINLYSPDGALVHTVPAVPAAAASAARATGRAATQTIVTGANPFKNESGYNGWHTVIDVVAEQRSLNRLVAGVLPVVAVIGVLGAGAMLFRGAMMRRGMG